MGDSIEQVVDQHARHLQKTFGNRSSELKLFVDRLENDPEAARAEAVVFAWLYQTQKNPKLNELAGTGGMDFKCQSFIGGEFLVEVTSLGTDVICAKSGLSTDVTCLGGGAYRKVTPELRLRVKDKLSQLGTGGQLPRILVIASEHPKATLVLDRSAAINLFVSDWKFCVPLSDPSAVFNFTNLKDAVFFQPENENSLNLTPRYPSVSAILLVSIYVDRIRAVGLVHPEPRVKLPIEVLPEVPLVYLPSWPVTDGKLTPRWTLPSDPPFPEHKRVRI